MGKISELPPADALTGEETIPLVQDGETVGAPMDYITDLAQAALQPQADAAAASAATAQAWAEGTLPGGAGTKSAKEWAGEAEAVLAEFRLFPNYGSATAAERAFMDCIRRLQFEGVPADKFISLKFGFLRDVGTRFNVTFVIHEDADGTGVADACTFSVSSGADTWSEPREIVMTAVGGSGITGSFIFTPPASPLTVNVASTTAAMFQRRAVNRDAIASSSSRNNAIDSRASSIANSRIAALVNPHGQFAPFRSDHDEAGSWSFATDPYFLRKFIKSLRIYGPKADYRVGYVKNTDPRRIDIVDHATGRTVCRLAPGAGQPWPTKIKRARGGTLALSATGWRGCFAVAELDPAVGDAMGGEGPYATLARGGIDQSFVHDYNEVRALVLAQETKHTIRVGPGRTYETVSAVNADSRCLLAHPHEMVRVIFDPGTFAGVNFQRPEYVFWEGSGIDVTFLSGPSGATQNTVESPLDGGLSHMTIHAEANRYPLHIETNSLLWGGVDQERGVVQVNGPLKLTAGAENNTNLIGGGIGALVEIHLDAVLRHRAVASNSADLSFHNTASLTTGGYDPAYTMQAFPSKLVVTNCPEATGVKTTGGDFAVISLIPDADPGSPPMSTAVLRGNDFDLTRRILTDATSHQWQVIGANVTVSDTP